MSKETLFKRWGFVEFHRGDKVLIIDRNGDYYFPGVISSGDSNGMISVLMDDSKCTEPFPTGRIFKYEKVYDDSLSFLFFRGL